MASPASTPENLEERITCKTCNQIFKDPRLLSCYHSFCLSCLEQLMEDSPRHFKVSCPLCKSYTILPKGGIKFLPCDNKGKRLTEKFGKMKSNGMNQAKVDKPHQDVLPELINKLVPSCQHCSLAAKFVCIDCESAFCQKCKEVHENENVRNYDDHYILALRKELHCSLHTGNLVTGVCSDCKKNLCPICSNKHSQGHDIFKLKMHTQYREKLKTEIDYLTSRIHSFEIAIAETQKMLAFYTDVIRNVKSTFSDISTKVMTRIIALEEECLINVQRACKKHSEHLNMDFLDDLTSSKMQHLIGDIRHALASPPDHCLSMFKDLCSNSQDLRSIQVPDMKFGIVIDKLKVDSVVQPTLNHFIEQLDALFGNIKKKVENLSEECKDKLDELDMWHLENAEFAELDVDGMFSDTDSDIFSCLSPDQSDTDLNIGVHRTTSKS